MILDIYANLALHVKLYDDLQEKGEQLLATGKWSSILKIWDSMAVSKYYCSVTTKDFVQKDRSKKKAKANRDDSHKFDIEDELVVTAPPPS